MKRVQNNQRRILKGIVFLILITFTTYLISKYGIEKLKSVVEIMGPWAPIGIFTLRFSSVVIPALPGTAYSLLAGALLGFKKGLLIICLSDLASCSISFFISRRYGKKVVNQLVGPKFIQRVETLSRKHLETNFFLMTGFLMTGFFDFISYGLGLTKVKWVKFIPALSLSIIISNPPVVALGSGLLDGGKKIVFIALGFIFLLALLTNKLRAYAPEIK